MENQKPLGLPEEFIDYVNEGKTLDWRLFEGYIYKENTVFCPIDQLEKQILNWRNFMVEDDPNQDKEGYYPVEYVSLVKDRGALVWFPQLKCFGQFDEEHDEIFAFQGVTWEQFLEKQTGYLNALFKVPEADDDEIGDTYDFFFCPYDYEQFEFSEN